MMKSIARLRGVLPRIALSAALGALLLPSATQAAPTYTVTVLGGADSEARDINEAGQVAGYLTAGGVNHAFFYDGSVLNDLGTLGYTRSIGNSLNDNGTVVGTAYSDGGERTAFVYASGAVSALPFTGNSGASAINNAGLIVGDKYFPDGEGGNVIHAYTYAGGVVTDLGTVPNGYNSYADGVNEAGHVTGTVEVDGPPNYPSHPFLYTGGPLQDLGDFGGIFSHGYAINNHDQVVGTAGRFNSPEVPDDIYPRRAFLYENGVLQDLGSLLDNGSSIAYDINDAGLIVGVSATADENAGGAFLYVEREMVLLDSLIDPASGWSVHNAYAINEAGQIAGSACKAGLCYAVRLDLAPAIPEPAQFGMFGAGAFFLLGRRFARRAAGCAAGWRDRLSMETTAHAYA